MRSEVLKRLISGFSLGLGSVAVIALDYGNSLFMFICMLILSILSVNEFYTLASKPKGGAPFRRIGIIFSIGILLTYYAQFLVGLQAKGVPLYFDSYEIFTKIFYPGFSLTPLFLLLLLFSSGVAQVFMRSQENSIYNLGTTLFGPIYTVVTLSQGMLLLLLPQGVFYIILFLLLAIGMDAGAYFSGTVFGKHRTGFFVSPNKSYEGYIGGILFSILVGVTFHWGYESYLNTTGIPVRVGYGETCILAVIVSLIAIVGDLMESNFKRTVSIKDSSGLIPGHGGILDMLDAIYWSIPLGYYYLVLRQSLGFSLL